MQQCNKAKGIRQYVSKQLTSDDYKACVFDKEKIIIRSQNIFKSRLHHIYTENVKKAALNGGDLKRFILSDSINTLALGHYMIRELNESS